MPGEKHYGWFFESLLSLLRVGYQPKNTLELLLQWQGEEIIFTLIYISYTFNVNTKYNVGGLPW